MRKHKVIDICLMLFALVGTFNSVVMWVNHEYVKAVIIFIVAVFLSVSRAAIATIDGYVFTPYKIVSKCSYNISKHMIVISFITLSLLSFFTLEFMKPSDVAVNKLLKEYNSLQSLTQTVGMTEKEFRQLPVALQWDYVDSTYMFESVNNVFNTAIEAIEEGELSKEDVTTLMNSVDDTVNSKVVESPAHKATAIYLASIITATAVLYFVMCHKHYTYYIELCEEMV